MKNILILILVAALAFVLFNNYLKPRIFPVAVNSFEECVTKKYPVTETLPRQCKTPNGKVFTEDIGNTLEKQNLIRVTTPRPNELVASPLVIKGEARGTWYFEASFPVKIFDANGKQLGVVPAQAQGEWMTENFVPFIVTLNFEAPTTKTGTLVLEKDNPSGLPQFDDHLSFPINFAK